jgi:Fic family protein
MPSLPDPRQPTTHGAEHDLAEPLQTFQGLTDALSAELQDVEAAQARYREESDAGRILPNSVEAVRVELTYHSNAIEGSTLSLRETQLVLEGYAPPGGKTLREVYEARNHDRALRMIERWAQERPRTAPVTDQDLLDVHAQVLADIDPVSAGRFRDGRVLIKGTRFIPPGSHKFGDLIPRALELTTAGDVPPALQAAELHYNLVAIHPFRDGNGRTARLLMNYHLLRHGYPHAIIEVGDRAEYLLALEEANAGRCARFAGFVLRSVARSIRKLTGEGSLP